MRKLFGLGLAAALVAVLGACSGASSAEEDTSTDEAALAESVTHPFHGVTMVRLGDRVMVVADLCAAGVSVRATEYSERDATPEEWAMKPQVDADVAINGDFFDFPGWTKVFGRARGGGQDWPAGHQNLEPHSYWEFGPRIAANIASSATVPSAEATQIIGGHDVIIRNGRSLAPDFDGDVFIKGAARRTGVGLDATRTKLYLFSSNTALTGAQMATSMLQLAAAAGFPHLEVATNEDGGGSAQMYVRGHGQIIDSGRHVNNHLGIIAKGSGAAPMCVTGVAPPAVTKPKPPPHAHARKHCGRLSGAGVLAIGQVLESCDGQKSLSMQHNGQLVLRHGAKVVWVAPGLGDEAVMQGDGNFVLYSHGAATFSSHSAGHPGSFLDVQDDGNVVVYDGSDALWSTQTE